MIEIHLDGKPVTKLQAARSVAKPGGQSVDIGEPNAEGWLEDYVTVYARRRGIEEIFPPGVHWASYVSVSAADAREFAEMIALGAEIAELAEMLAAEKGAPESAPRCTWCHEPAVDGEYCAPCTAAKAKVNAPGQGAPLHVLTAGEEEDAENIAYLACGDQSDDDALIGAAAWCPRHGETQVISAADYMEQAMSQ